MNMDNDSGAEPSPKRRRASRAGQAKRFECGHPGCGKRYSRAEHLHRHELNHNPPKIYRCDAPDCGHTFVRLDLYVRHKARHDDQEPGMPGSANTGEPNESITEQPGHTSRSAEDRRALDMLQQVASSHYHTGHTAGQADSPATIRWTPISQPMLSTPAPSLPRSDPTLSNGYSSTMGPQSITSPDLTFTNSESWGPAETLPSNQANDNFAAWLFESPGSQDNEFNITNLPFLEFGLQCSPKDIWGSDENSITGNSAVLEHPSTSPAVASDPLGTPESTKSIFDYRKSEITSILAHFYRKQYGHSRLTEDQAHLLYTAEGQIFPNITTGVLDNLVANYWLSSQQMPIVHEPTFSSNSCHILLLLAMIALGATDLVRSKPRGEMPEYKELAQLIMTQLRWEIFTDGDAQPPIQLWVAQALLLLEYYEKQCSTRKLHERAHIHHGTTLTLLRRGNPLVGRSESETPPSGLPSRPASPVNNVSGEKRSESSLQSWWTQWARNESFNRVVFIAFQMDTLHAVLYGHAADMAPYEIRLPLPCDDSLWHATNAYEVQRLDANLKMYGIRPINFLDGLKRCLHAHDVQTHAPARMLLMSGLLSVGWHISRREKHLQFLETIPSGREQGRWRLLLLRAFGHWRDSFDSAIGSRNNTVGSNKVPDWNSARAGVLYHLAHMTLHVDIIDCQIFAGTKQLLGRKVSKKDYTNVVQRMKTWACTPIARHAALHAYKLLSETLVKPSPARRPPSSEPSMTTIVYNCRTDPIIFRPWALFIAGLIIWAYQHASSLYLTSSPAQHIHLVSMEERPICCRYLATCAAIEDPAQLAPVLSTQGCAAVLSVLSQNFADADPELLHEASKRLQECRDALGTSNLNWIGG